MPRQEMSTISSATNSKGENVPEIDALGERVRLIGQSLDWWNNKMVWSLILAAISALFVVLTTVMALKRSGEKDEAQSELIQAKDRQLALDLGAKDMKIEEAKRAAAEANERAEHEALERAKLEAEFVKQGPRFTLLRTHRDDLIKKLRSLAGQRFTTLNEFVNTDTEAIRTSSEITVILESEADWHNNTPHGSSGGANMYGVGVMVRILPTASGKTRENARQLFEALRKALLTGVQFAENGQDVKAALPPTFPFDEDTVLIEVGEHPVPISTPYTKSIK